MYLCVHQIYYICIVYIVRGRILLFELTSNKVLIPFEKYFCRFLNFQFIFILCEVIYNEACEIDLNRFQHMGGATLTAVTRLKKDYTKLVKVFEFVICCNRPSNKYRTRYPMQLQFLILQTFWNGIVTLD